ncbi:MAG: hypothetical protein AMS14_03825 [Planctomycetes bacterium DG_20]|nr:MAG: hypothetical protein AMS14_03825 [Planctomycetes bacterium DG_20]
MANESVKVPARPVVAVALAAVVSLTAPFILPRPLTAIMVAMACFAPCVAANAILCWRLRSWSLAKVTALTALLHCLIVLCAYVPITADW